MLPPQPRTADLTQKLREADSGALMDLYDRTATAIYGYLLHVTGSEETASIGTRRAFLAVWSEPSLLTSDRVSYDVQMVRVALTVHRAATAHSSTRHEAVPPIDAVPRLS